MSSYGASPRQIRLGFGGPPSRDVIVLLVVVGLTFSLGFFTDVLEWLRLTPLVWQGAFLWQLATYPWIGLGSASPWILLELLILYWFANDVFSMLGRRRFWRLLVGATLVAAVGAVVVDAAIGLGSGGRAPYPSFVLMQGQRMLLLVVIAAFATLRSGATILLFFVLPIQARWFLWLEIAFAFLGFLGSKDFSGFVGCCLAVAWTFAVLRYGGAGRWLRELRLRAEARWIQRKLGGRRRSSALRLVRDEKGDGGDSGSASRGGNRWIN